MLMAILRLSCPEGGVVLDLFPSEKTAKLVVASGRKYMSIGALNRADVVEEEPELFTEEVGCEKVQENQA
jgi:hypothetical protein